MFALLGSQHRQRGPQHPIRAVMGSGGALCWGAIEVVPQQWEVLSHPRRCDQGGRRALTCRMTQCPFSAATSNAFSATCTNLAHQPDVLSIELIDKTDANQEAPRPQGSLKDLNHTSSLLGEQYHFCFYLFTLLPNTMPSFPSSQANLPSILPSPSLLRREMPPLGVTLLLHIPSSPTYHSQLPHIKLLLN